MNGYFAKQKLGGAGHVHPYLCTPGGPYCTFLYSLLDMGGQKNHNMYSLHRSREINRKFRHSLEWREISRSLLFNSDRLSNFTIFRKI